jgi:hypothetical protein
MHSLTSARPNLRQASFLAAALLLGGAAHRAHASDLLGLYVGASAGEGYAQSTRDNSYFAGPGPEQQASHPAYAFFAGIRPTTHFGVELEHVNFGPAPQGFSFDSSRAVMHGNAAFGVLYLPVAGLEPYLKLGVARLQSRVSGVTLNIPVCIGDIACPLFQVLTPYAETETSTHVASAAGLQYRLGSWSIRGEYAHFTTDGVHPDVASVGLLKSF